MIFKTGVVAFALAGLSSCSSESQLAGSATVTQLGSKDATAGEVPPTNPPTNPLGEHGSAEGETGVTVNIGSATREPTRPPSPDPEITPSKPKPEEDGETFTKHLPELTATPCLSPSVFDAANGPFPIRSVDDLKAMQPGKHYVLQQDINLTGTAWESLPMHERIFLDGAGHSITGLKIVGASPVSDGKPILIGLFSSLECSVIARLKVVAPEVSCTTSAANLGSSGATPTGAVVGHMGSSVLYDVEVIGGTVTCQFGGVAGGLAGTSGDSWIVKSKSSAAIAGEYAGGLVGNVHGRGILQSSNSGSVAASYGQAGGIAATIGPYTSTIPIKVDGVTNEGSVRSESMAGGVFGSASGSGDISVKNASNKGAVRGLSAGGVFGGVGNIWSLAWAFDNLSNSGSVTIVAGAMAPSGGGIFGAASGSTTITVGTVTNSGDICAPADMPHVATIIGKNLNSVVSISNTNDSGYLRCP